MQTQDKPEELGERTQAHTPGPWEIYKAEGSDFIDIVIQPGYGEIARLSTGEPKSEANAQLIAAAPETKAQRDELLADMREIAEGKGPFSMDPLTHASNTIEAMVSIARAAIARAEGSKP